MNPKEEFDALVKLAEFRQSRRDLRYQAILRVSVGLWAVLAAATIYLRPRPPEWLLLLGLFSVVIGHAILARQMQLSNWVDMNTAFYYIERAEKILLGQGDVRQRPKAAREMSWRERWMVPLDNNIFAPGFWVVPTALLSFAAYFLVGGKTN